MLRLFLYLYISLFSPLRVIAQQEDGSGKSQSKITNEEKAIAEKADMIEVDGQFYFKEEIQRAKERARANQRRLDQSLEKKTVKDAAATAEWTKRLEKLEALFQPGFIAGIVNSQPGEVELTAKSVEELLSLVRSPDANWNETRLQNLILDFYNRSFFENEDLDTVYNSHELSEYEISAFLRIYRSIPEGEFRNRASDAYVQSLGREVFREPEAEGRRITAMLDFINCDPLTTEDCPPENEMLRLTPDMDKKNFQVLLDLASRHSGHAYAARQALRRIGFRRSSAVESAIWRDFFYEEDDFPDNYMDRDFAGKGPHFIAHLAMAGTPSTPRVLLKIRSGDHIKSLRVRLSGEDTWHPLVWETSGKSDLNDYSFVFPVPRKNLDAIYVRGVKGLGFLFSFEDKILLDALPHMGGRVSSVVNELETDARTDASIRVPPTPEEVQFVMSRPDRSPQDMALAMAYLVAYEGQVPEGIPAFTEEGVMTNKGRMFARSLFSTYRDDSQWALGQSHADAEALFSGPGERNFGLVRLYRSLEQANADVQVE